MSRKKIIDITPNNNVHIMYDTGNELVNHHSHPILNRIVKDSNLNPDGGDLVACREIRNKKGEFIWLTELEVSEGYYSDILIELSMDGECQPVLGLENGNFILIRKESKDV